MKLGIAFLVDHGISLLSRRPHSRFELKQKLNRLCQKHRARSNIRISKYEKKQGFEPRSKELFNTRLKARKAFLDCTEAVPLSLLELEERKFIDDSKYALWHIEQRIRHRPRSKKELQSELYQKGLKSETIESALFKSKHCDAQECHKLVQNKVQRQFTTSKIKTQLIRRGFHRSTVEQLLVKENEEE